MTHIRHHLSVRTVLLVLSVLAVVSARADDDFATLVKKGDAFDAALKTKEALAVYLEAEKLQPNDANLLHKIAKQYGETMDDVPSNAEKQAYGVKSLDYAKRSMAADPNNALAQLAVAVAYGRLATYLDNKTKIAYSKLVKEHVDKSLALDPNNDLTYHVLGAWNYELANLNPILRAIARLIYGDIPAASNEDAVKDFKKAIELNPKRLANQVELGRTYVAMGQKDLARAALEKGLAMPNRQRDDDVEKQRAREALKKL
jgi:tetratricopeptide (TPR) repeat protein